MNAPVSLYQFTPEPPGIFDELDEVRLLKTVRTDRGVTVPEGSVGTILGVWARGAAYEVEFDSGLATIEAADLARAD